MPTLNTPPSRPSQDVVFTAGPRRYVSGLNSMLTTSHCSPTIAAFLIIFQFVIHLPCVDAVDLDTCGTRLLRQQNTTHNTTNALGSPSVLRISYEQCLVECGTGLGDVNWQGFSQNFGAWFLPWVSLMFQIPFGAERKFKCCVNIPCWTSREEQDHWMTLSLSSSPWVLPLSRPTPSR